LGGQIVGSSTAQGKGITLAGNVAASLYGGQYNIIGTTFLNNSAGLTYGSFIQGVTINQANFTGGNNGIIVPAGATGSLVQLGVFYSQFENAEATISVGTPVGAVNVIGSLFFIIPGQCGISGDLVTLNIIGNSFNGTAVSGNTGICLSSTSGLGFVNNNNFSTIATGTSIASGAQLIQVPANVYSAVTTNVVDNGTNDAIGYGNLANTVALGTTLFATNNSGFNQLFDGAGVGLRLGIGNGTTFSRNTSFSFQNQAGTTTYFSVGSTGNILTPLTIANLPTCSSGAKGAIAYVSDTVASAAPSFHGTVAGGGSTSVNSLVSCNGTNWQWD
jgi:hypothetical protein